MPDRRATADALCEKFGGDVTAHPALARAHAAAREMFELVDIPRAGIIGLVDLGPGHVFTPTYHRVRRNGRDLGRPERHEACGGVEKRLRLRSRLQRWPAPSANS